MRPNDTRVRGAGSARKTFGFARKQGTARTPDSYAARGGFALPCLSMLVAQGRKEPVGFDLDVAVF
jgi:hypothetical protein